MLALLGDERIPTEGQVQLNNALGLEFEGRKEYDRAFEFIDRGNKIRRGEEFYDRVEDPHEWENRIDNPGLKTAIEDLAKRLDPMKFNDADFRNSDLIRLKVIAAHCEQGRLNSRLEWQQ